jgi:hypothetical protein
MESLGAWVVQGAPPVRNGEAGYKYNIYIYSLYIIDNSKKYRTYLVFQPRGTTFFGFFGIHVGILNQPKPPANQVEMEYSDYTSHTRMSKPKAKWVEVLSFSITCVVHSKCVVFS